MKKFYELWAKGGASPKHRTENKEEYIKGFNWLKGWADVYFFNKGLDNLISILLFTLLFIIVFHRNKKKNSKNSNSNIYKVLLVILILFGEWFYKHPTLRYGGYSSLTSLIFLPTALFLAYSQIKRSTKKKLVVGLVITTLLIFNLRNIKRINKEMKIYSTESFPFFYIPKVDFNSVKLANNVNIHIPENNACWAIKTPCAGGSEGLGAKKIFGYDVFIKK